MAREEREINIAVPDLLSGPISRRTWVKGAGLMAAAFGVPGLMAACGTSSTTGGGETSAADLPVPPAEPEAEKQLNFFNWTAYIDDPSNAPDVPPEDLTLPKFERESGITVNYQEYASNDEMLQKVRSGNSGFDIVVPSDYVIPQMVARKLIRPLDKSKIPNFYNNQAESFKGLFYDPENDYSVVWGNGNTGIGVNKDVVTETVTDASIFGNAAYKGKMSILDEYRSTIALALFYLGLDPTTGNPEELDKAFDQLTKWKENATITSDYQDPFGAGDLVVSHAYSGDVYQQVTATGKNLEYVIPTQGADKYVDSMVVLADAPHPGNAHVFMNFVYEPEVSANLMTAITYRNANKAAYDLLPPELRNNPIVFPPKDVEDRLDFVELTEETAALWKEKWDVFLAS